MSRSNNNHNNNNNNMEGETDTKMIEMKSLTRLEHDDDQEEEEEEEDNEKMMQPLVETQNRKSLVEILTPPAPFSSHYDDDDSSSSQSSNYLYEEGHPHHPHHGHHGHSPTGTATPKQTAINIFISFVGAGMLGMPYAFSRSGWLLGTITLCAVSTANVYAMLLLVQTRKKIQANIAASNYDNKHQKQSMIELRGYGDVGGYVLGPSGGKFVNLCLVISQVGFATSYIIFIAANLQSLFSNLPRFGICYGCVPLLALLVQVNDMKTLSPFSLVADVSNVSGLIVVMFQDYELYHHEEVNMVNMSSFFYVVAVSLYSLEGVGLVLPLESSCVDREGFPMLLTKCLVGITALMCVFGVAGYLAFGESTMAPVTLNLDGGWAAYVKVALCVALYLTYPVMMFPVNEVLEEMFLTKETSSSLSLSLSSTSVATVAAATTTTTNANKRTMRRQKRQILEQNENDDGDTTNSESSFSSSSYSKQKDKKEEKKKKEKKKMKQQEQQKQKQPPQTHHHHHHHHPKPARIFRTTVVLTSATIAYAIPDFGKFLGLVGSSICTILGFILPCFLHTVVFGWRELKWWELGLNLFLIVFGVVFGVVGTYQSFQELVFEEEEEDGSGGEGDGGDDEVIDHGSLY